MGTLIAVTALAAFSSIVVGNAIRVDRKIRRQEAELAAAIIRHEQQADDFYQSRMEIIKQISGYKKR